MSLEDRKRTALEFVAGIAAGGFPEGMIAEQFTGWSSLSHDIDRAEYLRRIAIVGQIFGPEQLALTFDRVIAEGDSVSVQARGQGTLITGVPYSQNYLFIVEFNARGQVRHAREYFDTHLVHATLVPAMQHWRQLHAPAENG